MSKAGELLGKVKEQLTGRDAKGSVKALLKEIEEGSTMDFRSEIEMALDEAGLLKGKEGKQFYRADGFLDKSLDEFKRLEKML